VDDLEQVKCRGDLSNTLGKHMIVYHLNMPSGALAFTGETDELAILGPLPYPRPHLLDTRRPGGGGLDRKSRSRNNCFSESRIRDRPDAGLRIVALPHS
jgi:hypothetical protein